MEKKRLISLPEALDKMLVDESEKWGQTVTGLIKIILWRYFESKEQTITNAHVGKE